MEISPNFTEFTEPTASRLREQFAEFLATIPAPSEMSDEQLDQVGEVLAQVSIDVLDAFHLVQAEEQRREADIN
ncbi:hypothetical protein [Dietzia cinnamea]|uniref:hypothetical protein n=1 Tax=Dietzia cinnamea TaxID=321318 RepID=UPI00223BC008|nr:hypothetical protein [Dietzia cinnamea]MCT2077438.1 hypothetical protein [Dietzia cinnamea]MCT2221297.1 hypothetical protein [Dietzia cinnamea]